MKNTPDKTIGSGKVFVLDMEGSGLAILCKYCRNQIENLEGKLLIAIRINENGNEYKYLLGSDDHVMCCGEKKNIPLSFATNEEALAEVDRIVEYIRVHKSTKGLRLLTLSRLSNN